MSDPKTDSAVGQPDRSIKLRNQERVTEQIRSIRSQMDRLGTANKGVQLLLQKDKSWLRSQGFTDEMIVAMAETSSKTDVYLRRTTQIIDWLGEVGAESQSTNTLEELTKIWSDLQRTR